MPPPSSSSHQISSSLTPSSPSSSSTTGAASSVSSSIGNLGQVISPPSSPYLSDTILGHGPMQSSRSQPSSHVENPRRDASSQGLPWTGILNPDQVAALLEEFSDLVVCPGYASTFGHHADEWGRVFIAGANRSFIDARRTLERWREKSSGDERWSWWPAAMADRGIKPITARHILEGLQLTEWQEHRIKYNKISKARLMARRSNELRQAARNRLSEGTTRQAAKVLGGLQQTSESTQSMSSQTSTSPSSPDRSHRRATTNKRP